MRAGLLGAVALLAAALVDPVWAQDQAEASWAVGVSSDYAAWNVGLTHDHTGNVGGDVRYHDTDLDDPLGDSRIVGSLTVDF